MAENKTKQTDSPVEDFINAVDGEQKRKDSWDMIALMEQLGPHRTGKSCLYIKNLDVVDRTVLKKLISQSVKDMRKKYPDL